MTWNNGKPDYMQKYWYRSSGGNIRSTSNCGNDDDNYRIAMGNAFQSEEECQSFNFTSIEEKQKLLKTIEQLRKDVSRLQTTIFSAEDGLY